LPSQSLLLRYIDLSCAHHPTTHHPSTLSHPHHQIDTYNYYVLEKGQPQPRTLAPKSRDSYSLTVTGLKPGVCCTLALRLCCAMCAVPSALCDVRCVLCAVSNLCFKPLTHPPTHPR